ncbi:hypothetical protein [Alcanivorax quisquiliarum]|uniref:Uncharacterized protein n=1 Tax=Alcanivorax quisquiliarum TaxID=2933565 RepID=A0ABT0E5B4_9GAMM|nr:hypothetical protein [Alcanivorax quisquiliarum]MCK0536879.1 hypothetical protein [Alcanivorax quisquiliarum]
MQTQIGCPDCGTTIPIDTKLLLSGQRFMCSRCALSISLASESHALVQDAVRGFDRLVAMKEAVGEKATRHLKQRTL